MRKLILPALVAPLFLLQGCAAVLGIGAGALIGQEVLDDDTYVARIDMSASRLWPSAKTTLSHMSLKPLDVDDAQKSLVADVDQAKVTVSVETHDMEQSVMRVNARKYGVSNPEIAKMVLDNILADLDK